MLVAQELFHILIINAHIGVAHAVQGIPGFIEKVQHQKRKLGQLLLFKRNHIAVAAVNMLSHKLVFRVAHVKVCKEFNDTDEGFIFRSVIVQSYRLISAV